MGASAAPNMTVSFPCADALRLMLRIQPRSFQAAARRPSPGLATGARWLVQDANSRELANIPLALTAFTLLTTGVIIICWGMAVTSAWLTAAGFLLTMPGGLSRGWTIGDN